MKNFVLTLVVFVFVVAQSAHADTAIVNAPTATPVASAPTVNKTAKDSSGSAAQTIVADGIAAAGFIAAAIATPNPTAKAIFYAMAAATVAQGLLMSGGKDNADQVDNASYSAPIAGVTGPTTPGAGFDSGTGGGFAVPPELANAAREVKDAGYFLSPDGSTLTMPDGSSVSTAALASGNAPGLPMTDDIKKQADWIVADALKKASGPHVVAIGTADGGGHLDKLGGSNDAAPGRFDMAKYLKGLAGQRNPSSVSGLSKKLGEDNIGIKSDNIFEMVSRQYKRKQSQRAFLTN